MTALRRLLAIDGRSRRDLAWAAIELAVARFRIRRVTAHELWAMRGDLAPDASPLIDRVAFAIPRVAARLPWRSDCLVQALAARRWLTRGGIATSLVLGVEKGEPASFAAHAWLLAGDRIVTGGDIGGFHEMTR